MAKSTTGFGNQTLGRLKRQRRMAKRGYELGFWVIVVIYSGGHNNQGISIFAIYRNRSVPKRNMDRRFPNGPKFYHFIYLLFSVTWSPNGPKIHHFFVFFFSVSWRPNCPKIYHFICVFFLLDGGPMRNSFIFFFFCVEKNIFEQSFM